MSETSSDSAGTALPDPPAANQGKDEPIATAPAESPQSSSAESSEAGSGTPPSADADDADGVGAADTQTAATLPASATGGVPVPGDSQGVSVPSVQAAAGTSEESDEVQGIRITSIAPPGKPDGEVDTRG